MKKLILYMKIIINLLIFVLIGLFLIYILPGLLRFFMPFVIGWIIAMIANPLVKFLEKRVKLLRKHSSAIIIILAIAMIVGIIYIVISIIVKELIDLVNNYPMIIENLGNQFAELSERLRLMSRTLPSGIQNVIDELIISIKEYTINFVANIEPPSISTAGTFARNIAEVLFMIIITIISAYFFIAERDVIVSGLKKVMPASAIGGWQLICDNFKTAIGGYFKAQFKIMIVISIVMFIGFEILRVEYSFLLALGIAFLDFLPVFGTGAIIWPWALIDMINGNYFRGIGLIVIYLLCQIIKQVLQPKFVGDSIGISPFATLIFMFIGYRLYGFFGLIIGIPIGMILINMYRIGMFNQIIKGFKIILYDINEFRKF